MNFNLKKFHDIRVDNDLSQREMAKILNISEDIYSNYENGRSLMSIEVAIKFADFFHLSLDYLLNLSKHKILKSSKTFSKEECAKTLFGFRKQNGLSQTQISKVLNIPQRTYSSYEHGDRTIPLEFLFNFALNFNVSLDYLTNRKEEKNI